MMGGNTLDVIHEAAIAQAHKSTMLHRHGAVIVNKTGEILGRGYNQMHNFYSHQYSMHAEVAAIQNLKKNKMGGYNHKEDFTMIVVRICGKDGDYTRCSKPCIGCQKEIEKMGIKRVFYST